MLAFRPEGDDVPARFRDPTSRFPRIEVIRAALERLELTIDGPTPAAARGIVLLGATKP